MKAAGARLILAAGFAAAWLGPAANSQGITFDKAALTIMSATGRHEFVVDVADNQSRIDMGLKYRHEIDPNGGLLIIKSRRAPDVLQVTTEGVSLPVDLLFIAADGTVMEVHPWVTPDSSTPIVSVNPVAAALELAGGTITRYGMLPGDVVVGGGLGPSG
jgi:uncharacterized protein